MQPNSLVLMPAFGAGLTWCAHLVRWGERVTPLVTTTTDLPPCSRTALEMVNEIRSRKHAHDVSEAGLMGPLFAEASIAQ